jgi:hypothetical protein
LVPMTEECVNDECRASGNGYETSKAAHDQYVVWSTGMCCSTSPGM